MTDRSIRIQVRGRWLRLQIRHHHDQLTNKQRRRILFLCFLLFMLAGCLVLIHGCGDLNFRHIEPVTLNF